MIAPAHPRRALWLAALLACLAVALGLTMTDGAGVAGAASGPSPAAVAPGAEPATFSLGFVDDQLFVQSSARVQNYWLGKAQGLGSSWVRIGVVWATVAPWDRPRHWNPTNAADRNYRWGQLDRAVRAAVAHGQTPLLDVHYAPRWAEGRHRPKWAYGGSWEPSATAYGQFARALAQRYSGSFPDPLHRGRMLPQVTNFQAWNEPNLPKYITPEWVEDSHHHILPAAPAIYRNLLNAFYLGIKAVQPGATVLMAGLAPYGDPPGVGRMRPVYFLRQVECLSDSLRPLSCPSPVYFDGLDDHPYSAGPQYPAHYADDVSVPDQWKLTRVADAGVADGHVLPAAPKPVWITELGFSTTPPYDSDASQLRDLPLACFYLWKQGVTHFFWFQIEDPLGHDNAFAGEGLFTRSHRAKPATAAYRFPFVAVRENGDHGEIWGLAPVPGVVTVQIKGRGHWRALLTTTSTPGGIFDVSHTLKRGSVLRAVAGGRVSPAWAVG